jgi:hypothetical protein
VSTSYPIRLLKKDVSMVIEERKERRGEERRGEERRGEERRVE